MDAVAANRVTARRRALRAGLPAAAAAIGATMVLPAGGQEASDIKADECVLLFPISARKAEDGTAWIVPVHGWIFEPEGESTSRAALVAALARSLGLDEAEAQGERFRERAAWFLVDNERGKRVRVEVAGRSFVMPPSEENGHFHGELRLAPDVLDDAAGAGAPGPVPITALDGPDGKQVAVGQVRRVAPEGVSVISDIDDTIKKSDVLDRSELIANTFLRETRAVPGMADAYRRWEAAGAAFHYVSSSPWQLYPLLSRFLEDGRYPGGAMHLKHFRVKDESFLDLFASPERTKPPVIERILDAWPKRRFILVGDSGEKDPEVYGQVARAHPEQVLRVFIRRVEGSDVSPERMRHAFAGLPTDAWSLFDDPAALAGWTWED